MTVDDLLRYPVKRHVRTETPRVYTAYSSYKPFLRREFGRTCVYCRAHDGLRGQAAFVVEHYLCKWKHPRLETTYSNLYYACNTCNSLKASWPYMKVAGKWTRVSDVIPNPCDYVMSDHLEIEHSTLDIKSKSGLGDYAFTLLDLESRGTEHRNLRAVFERLRDDRAKFRQANRFARKKLRQGSLPPTQRVAVEAALATAAAALLRLESDFDATFGPAP